MSFDKRKSLQNALAYTQQGKWDRAIAEYQAILKADPKDLTVCNNLGDLYVRAGKPTEAIDQYLKLGELYRADGLAVKAIAVYKKILKLDPSRVIACLACADLYLEQGLVGEAKIQLGAAAEVYDKAGEVAQVVEIYRRLGQLDPSNTPLLVKLADILVRQGKPAEAADEYERAAQAAQAAGQAAEAKRLLKKARELAPARPGVTLGDAESLAREGRHAEAVEVLTRLTAEEPANGQAWRLWGESALVLGRPAEAVDALERARGFGVPEAELVRPMGQALIGAGRAAEVVPICERLAEEALNRGEPDDAVDVCRELLADGAAAIPLRAYFTTLLMSLGRDAEARQEGLVLAAAHEGAGDAPAALTVYRQLLGRDPADGEVRRRLEALAGPDQTLPSPATPAASPEAAPPDEEPLILEGIDDLSALLEERPGDGTLELEGEGSPEAVFTFGGGEAPGGVRPAGGGELSALELTLPDEETPLTLEPLTPTAEGGESAEGESELSALLAETLEEIHLEAAAEPPSGLAFELPAEETSDLPSFELPAEEEPAPGLAFELPAEETSDLPSFDLLAEEEPFAAVAPTATDGRPASAGPLPESTAEGSAPEPAAEEEPVSDRVAEQLAEADVYLKYGLEDKARERLLDVVRAAPRNLEARRRLKTMYLERREGAAACEQIVWVVEILASRGCREEALGEVREGLALASEHPELRRHLAALEAEGSAASPRGETRPAGPVPAPPLQAVPPAPEPPAAEEPAPPQQARLAPPEPAEALPEPSPAPEPAAAPDPGATLLLPPEWMAEPPAAGPPAPGREPLEEPEPAPILIMGLDGSEADQLLADDLAEAEFYLAQGMDEEARAVLRRLQTHHADHPGVVELEKRLAGESGPRPAARPPLSSGSPSPAAAPLAFPPPEAPPPPAISLQDVIPIFTVAAGRAGEEAAPPPEAFVDLGAELAEELAAEDRTPGRSEGPLVETLIQEFQRGIREHVDADDHETHYNLGVAYKDMELYDEAIEEFRLASRGGSRALECAELLGQCCLAKGEVAEAIRQLRAGLEVSGHPRQAYHGLRYTLALAHDGLGDAEQALAQLEIVQAEDPRFRDVATRLQRLRARARPGPGTMAPPAPGPPTSRGKKRISFI